MRVAGGKISRRTVEAPQWRAAVLEVTVMNLNKRFFYQEFQDRGEYIMRIFNVNSQFIPPFSIAIGAAVGCASSAAGFTPSPTHSLQIH